MKTVEDWMSQLNKKLSRLSQLSDKDNADNSPSEREEQGKQLREFSDTESEIEKAFVEYLKENNEVPDDTLLRYISHLTR